jgi:hypothetical protein
MVKVVVVVVGQVVEIKAFVGRRFALQKNQVNTPLFSQSFSKCFTFYSHTHLKVQKRCMNTRL